MSEQSFGKYTLLKKIATGGMAEVWLARQTGIEGFQRNLVVKRILPHLADDPEFVQMFLNEAKIAARFNHPNIAQIYDLGETNGQYFIAMEFIHGEDLGRLMRKAWTTNQWIARPLAIRIVASCCEGLYYAHTRADEQGRPLKVVHRDISPQNILISFDGSVKLVDFGIAKAADQASLTKSGAIKGKFAYMAPEQASGKPLDHRSDIFAIGLVLYELLTGMRPLKRDSEIATLQAALECAIEPPSKVADVPAELDSVVMRAIAKAADDRYRDARQFQLALEEFLVGQRWVASSVQISELMTTLFHDRLEEEARLGHPDPGRTDSQPAVSMQKQSSGRQSGSKRGSASGEMRWEAPPGAAPESSGERRGRSLAKGSYRSNPSLPAQSAEPPKDVPAWEAPEGVTEVPRRRTETSGRRATVTNETAVVRTPSRSGARSSGEVESTTAASRRSGSVTAAPVIDETRIAPPDDEEEDLESSARPSRSEMEEQDEEPAPPPPQRRASAPSNPRLRTSGGMPRRPTGTLSVREPPPEPVDPADEETIQPSASPPPPPRRKSVPPASGSGERPRKAPPASRMPAASVSAAPAIPASAEAPFLDLEKKRARRRHQQTWVLYACLAAVLGVTLFVFRQPLMDQLSHTESAGQDVRVRVVADKKVRVMVRHPREESSSRAGQTELLTEEVTAEPIRGAHLRDTIILENAEQGIYYEEPIPFGQPDEVREIRKTFATGHMKIQAQPSRKAEGLMLYEGPYPRGTYVPGQKVELYEGKHTLEVHDKAGTPVGHSMTVDIRPGEVTTVHWDVLKEAAAESASP